MRTLLIVFLFAGLRQDDEVRDWIRRLDDDSAVARDDAVLALAKKGRAIVPVLRAVLKGAGAEKRERIAEVIRRIERTELLVKVLPPAARVTLEARDRPLRGALEEVQKQVSTPLEFPGISPDDKVTVSLADVPFWDALERICRAHGGIDWELREKSVRIRKGTGRPVPRVFAGPLLFQLEEIRVTGTPVAAAGSAGQMVILLKVGWEKGVRPESVKMISCEVWDEAGDELTAPRGAWLGGQGKSVIDDGSKLMQLQSVYTQKIPGWRAPKLSLFKAEAVVEFGLAFDEVRFAEPKAGLSQGCDRFKVKIHSLTARGGVVEVMLETFGDKVAGLTYAFRLKDKAGREYRGAADCVTQSTINAEERCVYSARFSLPADAEPGSLSIRVPKEACVERLVLELKDLSLE